MEHRFRLKQGELELEFSGERDFVEAMAAKYAPSVLAGAPIPTEEAELDLLAIEAPIPRVSSEFRPRLNISCADLISMKHAKAPTDLVVVAAYYLEKYKQQDTFSPAALQAELLGVAGWECQVVDEVLPVVLLQGYLEALPGELYTLTYKGQTYVRDGLT